MDCSRRRRFELPPARWWLTWALAGTLGACAVFIEPIEGTCDDAHPCAQGQACRQSRCVAAGGSGGGSTGSGGSGGGSTGGAGGASGDAGFDAGRWLSGATFDVRTDFDAFNTWRGRPLEITTAWSCDDAANQAGVDVLNPVNGSLRDWQKPLDIALGGIFKDGGESWAVAGDGGYDDRWRASLEALSGYRSTRGTTYIRFAQEFNDGSKPWSVTATEVDDFKAAWGRFCSLKRTSFDAGLLVWNPNDRGDSGVTDVRKAYPGSDCVDVIGLRVHNDGDAPGFIRTPTQFVDRWNLTLPDGTPVGAEPFRQFALEKKVPFALCDWASVSSSGGGGDSSVFFQGVHDWLVLNGGTGPGQVAYEVLIRVNADYELMDGGQPDAAATYRALWKP